MYISHIVRSIITSIVLLLAASAAFGQCPTITVIGPPGLTYPGDEMQFRVDGAVDQKLRYRWMISASYISQGQGTPSISVATDKSMAGSNITAKVWVYGLPAACKGEASETAPVADIPMCSCVIDEWGKINPNDERGRLDVYFAELSNNPSNVGQMFLYVGANDRLDARHKRIKFIVKHARWRGFDVKRLWFVLEPYFEPPRTKLYRIPPGADPFKCDGRCVMIKGGDIK